MRLTKHTDYALRVLMYLGVRDDSLHTIRDIADGYDISVHHVTKVVYALGRHGYIQTIRGKGGGIRLHRSPDSINVGEVVRHMESDFALVECFGPNNRCVLTGSCILPTALSQAMTAFLEVLDRYTLADLVPARGQVCQVLRAM